MGVVSPARVRGGKLAQLLNHARSVVTVNSTAAQQALWRGLPTRTFGAAVEASGADLTPAERRRAERFATNIARTTRTYHSEATHFAYPGLRESEFHDRDLFPWLGERRLVSWSSFFRHSDRGSSFKLSELQTPDASRSYWVTGIPAWSAA